MTDFFQWLAGGSISSLIFIIVLGLAITGIIFIYVIAFLQGREVSFWPPKISEKPKKENKVEGKTDKLGRRIDTQSINAPILIRTLFSNNLGKGIKLGGLINDTSLEVVASDWARFRNAGWVRSGWLYKPDGFKEQTVTIVSSLLQDSNVSHAIAFFKIHLGDNGKGYIHILDAANPVHTIWLKTDAHFEREQEFCWNEDKSVQTTALWEFTWQQN